MPPEQTPVPFPRTFASYEQLEKRTDTQSGRRGIRPGNRVHTTFFAVSGTLGCTDPETA